MESGHRQWAIPDHRAIHFHPKPMGMTLGWFSITMGGLLFFGLLAGEFMLSVMIAVAVFGLAQFVTRLDPFGWKILFRSLSIPKVLWS